MKQGWTYKKLGEVCEVISGQSPEGKYYNSEGKGTPFYQGKKDFTSKYIGKPTVWTTEETKIAEKDDLLMSVRAPVGDVNFATQRLCIGRGLAAIRSKDNLNKEYLFYFLLAIKDNIKGKEGVGFASINRKEIMDIDLKYPTSLPEQQRIVSRLDSAFAHIDELKANAEKQVNEARALFQKALSKAMEPKEGWEEKKFGDVCSYHKEQGHYKDMRYIGMEHMESGTGELLNTISSDAVLSSSFKFNKGEVLYGRLRPYLRKVYIAEFDGCCSTEVFPIRSKTIKSGFIKYWLLSDEITNRINETSAGCRMPRGNMNEVKNFPFFYPKDQDQQRIVSRLDALSKNVKALEENQRKVMAECDALKQALLRKVFE